MGLLLDEWRLRARKRILFRVALASHSAIRVLIALARAHAPHVIFLSNVPVSYLTRRYM